MRERRDRPRVSPTDLAALAKCETEVVLGLRHGKRTTAEAKARMSAGTEAHGRFEAEDKRCFVASWALGPDHPDTESLRRWRDGVLLKRPSGRLLTRAYYLCSPSLISIMSVIPGARRISAWMVSSLSGILSRRETP